MSETRDGNGRAVKSATEGQETRTAGQSVRTGTKRISRNGGREGSKARPVLITGGAGFIGTNLAHRLLSIGHPVIIYDNLSRPGVEKNLEWLVREHGRLVEFERADVRDASAQKRAVRHASAIFHLAAQVAVTTSLVEPLLDFETNARGTLNLLEAVRAEATPPPLLFSSTNKVYGALENVNLVKIGKRYQPDDPVLLAYGINETRGLDFHSPYGCSKGAADQYVIDYARTFGLPAVVFRMSCIYGPHQFGTEDQGWVAHFLIRAIEGQPIILYGDGMQVRDVLFVDDLIEAFLLAWENIGTISGQAFNMGGSPANTVSLLELIDLIGELHGKGCAVEFAEWRHADQHYYVSDTRKFQSVTGWKPKIDVRSGVGRLYQWLMLGRGALAAPLVAGREGARRSPAPVSEAATGRG